jgi:hypothetical protein
VACSCLTSLWPSIDSEGSVELSLAEEDECVELDRGGAWLGEEDEFGGRDLDLDGVRFELPAVGFFGPVEGVLSLRVSLPVGI